jgi:hypothetical protein
MAKQYMGRDVNGKDVYRDVKGFSEGNWGESFAKLGETFGPPIVNAGKDILAGIGHTDEVMNQMLRDFGMDPNTASMITDPYDSLKQIAGGGMIIGGQLEPTDPLYNLPEDFDKGLNPPPAQDPMGAAAGEFSAEAPQLSRLPAYNQPEFVRPAAPDFSQTQAALAGLQDPTAPAMPTHWDMVRSQLAGAAGGAARGSTPGQVIALAAAGAFNAKEMKQSAYDEALSKYENTKNELARVKAGALSQIEGHQAEYDRSVALAENVFNQNTADSALRHDIADAQTRIAEMQLLQPQFHMLGNGMGVIVTRGPDGSMATKTIELDPLQRKLSMVLASAKLQSALQGGGRGDKTSVAVKVGGITSTFDQNDPMTPFLTMATVGLSNPRDPRARAAMDMARERMAQRYGGVDEDGELPREMQDYALMKPEDFAAELESTATLIYATSLMQERAGK